MCPGRAGRGRTKRPAGGDAARESRVSRRHDRSPTAPPLRPSTPGADGTARRCAGRPDLHPGARRVRIIDQAHRHHRLGPNEPARVREVRTLARGAELPGRPQHSSGGSAVAGVPVCREDLRQATARRRGPARGGIGEHEAQLAQARAVHACPRGFELPRPDDPQPRPVHERTSGRHQHRLAGVPTGGNRVRGPVT